jgi:hypothetical protein
MMIRQVKWGGQFAPIVISLKANWHTSAMNCAGVGARHYITPATLLSSGANKVAFHSEINLFLGEWRREY